MSLISSFPAAVLSAFMGAVAIWGVEALRERRSSLASVQHQITENYYRIEGQIHTIENGGWSEQYTIHVRLDAIEAIKARSPTEYIRFVERIDLFATMLSELETLRREQQESTRAEARVVTEEEHVVENLKETQELLVDVEQNLRDFSEATIFRRILYLGCLDESSFEIEE